jgi:hypothetical protein
VNPRLISYVMEADAYVGSGTGKEVSKMGFHVIERHLATHRTVRTWDAPDQDMDYWQARELMLGLGRDRPELHRQGSSTYLAVTSQD